LPHVLADRHADKRLADLDQHEVAACGEVAVLVEDAVVRQEALAVDRLDLAVGAHGARVVKVGLEVGEADERDDALRLRRDLLQRARGGADEAGSQQEVLGRITGHRELGEEREVRALVARLLEAREDQVAVAVEVAHDGIDLSESQPHRFRLTV